MKLKIISREVVNIDKNKLTPKFLFEFYLKWENKQTIISVVERGKEIGFLSMERAGRCMNQEDIDYYLKVSATKWSIDEKELGGSILELTNSLSKDNLSMCRLQTVLQYQNHYFICLDAYVNGLRLGEQRIRLKERLTKLGIATYLIGMPVRYVANQGLTMREPLSYAEANREHVEKILAKISNYDYNTVKSNVLGIKNVDWYTEKNRIENKPNIFLVGPCIVGGTPSVVPEETFAYLLEKRAKGYNVVRNMELRNRTVCFTSILEQDICKGDIVIFIDAFPDEIPVDIDLRITFRNNQPNKQLFTDGPLHTTRYGNELIVEHIMEKIIKPLGSCATGGSRSILHQGVKQILTYEAEEELDNFVQESREQALTKISPGRNLYDLNIGAIVMNANPFTLGHRYLVEYAAKQVDLLYVFVVEEDLSEFPFKVRKCLVEQGTTDLPNVCVVKSGKLIISRETFSDYFVKERISDTVTDSSLDVELFGKHIAPKLNIAVRFVGEEPFDQVTRAYNEKMKEILPEHGVKLVEIPRKSIHEEVVSATKVRKLFKEKQWEQLQTLLPTTTYEYLKSHENERFEKGVKNTGIDDAVGNEPNYLEKQWKSIQKSLDSMTQLQELLSRGEKIILYGLGHDCKLVLEQINPKYKDLIEYSDRKAINAEVVYEGKKVISPNKISMDSYVFVTSTRYRSDIYYDLRRKGLQDERILLAPDTILYDENGSYKW